MDAISALATISGLTDNSDDSEKQQQYQLQLMDKQSQINKNAASEQEAAQMRIFEKTGYAARVRQMKEAGLNPGLIYGTGASGGGGVTGNVSSAQVSQGSAPNVAGARQAKTQAMGMNLELAKLASEIEVNKSVAEANRSEAAYKSGAATEKITTETAGLAIDNEMKRIQTEIAAATQGSNINKIVSLADEAYWQMKKTMTEAKVSGATIDTQIQQYNANLKNTLAETLVKMSEERVNKEKAIQIVNEIDQKYLEINLKGIEREQKDTELKQAIDIALINNNAAMDRTELQKWLDLVGNLIIGGGLAARKK